MNKFYKKELRTNVLTQFTSHERILLPLRLKLVTTRSVRSGFLVYEFLSAGTLSFCYLIPDYIKK